MKIKKITVNDVVGLVQVEPLVFVLTDYAFYDRINLLTVLVNKGADISEAFH